MGRRRSDIDAELEELYAQVPSIPDCQGHCWISCGPADISDRELARIRERGIRITPAAKAKQSQETFFCEALGNNGLCRVYEIRPIACRLWGVMASMPCPYGCTPERWLTDEEGFQLVI